MGSGAKIIAQGNPQQVCGYPGWKLPAMVRLVALGAGAALPTVVAADTTDGLVLARTGVGILQVTFPATRRMGNINPQVWGATPETAATRKTAKVDADTLTTFPSVAASSVGQIQLYVSQDDTAANIDLVAGDILDICFWVDYG